MNNQYQNYCRALNLIVWEQKTSIEPTSSSIQPAAMDNLSSFSEDSAWSTLEQKVAGCTACALHQTRTQTVFGVGNRSAKLMIIGEAPGFHEDAKGEPFVGRAGQLLTAMLKSIGFIRDQVYIANILKCRPPDNRDPLPIEIKTCTPYLEQQIALVKPQLLLAVGRIAAHHLLQTKSSLENLRAKLHHFQTIPLIITYHPAYLLRNPKDKKKAFADLGFVLNHLEKY